MNETQWQRIVDRVKQQTEVLDHRTQPVAMPGSDVKGSDEILEFRTAAGRFKLVRSVRPVALGEEVMYTRRGRASIVRRKYSDTETRDWVTLYRWQNRRWVEVDFREMEMG